MHKENPRLDWPIKGIEKILKQSKITKHLNLTFTILTIEKQIKTIKNFIKNLILIITFKWIIIKIKNIIGIKCKWSQITHIKCRR
jgi:hypothetical protein